MSQHLRNISLEAHNVGDLLAEVARAHLHGGLPSTLLKRMKEGVDKYITEKELAVPGAAAGDRADTELARYLSGELEVMYDEWKKKEDSFYGM